MSLSSYAGRRGPGQAPGAWRRAAAVLGLAVPLAATAVTAVLAAAATTYTVTI